MESARILIAMANDVSSEKLKIILGESGYTVVEQCRDGQDCLRKVRAFKPDILILEYGLPLSNGMEVARVAMDDHICDVILIISSSQESMLGDIRSENGLVCMTKPLHKTSLVNAIDLMFKTKKRITALEKEIEILKANLDTRKEVEKAKGLLMKQMGLTESEAFKRIQKQSMDRGIAMREIARAIILAYDI